MKGDKCGLCNELAIGFQSDPGAGWNVCRKHASQKLISLKPGERLKTDIVGNPVKEKSHYGRNYYYYYNKYSEE